MKTKPFLLAVLLFAGFLPFAPTTSAVTPTLDCTVDKQQSDFVSSSGITAHAPISTSSNTGSAAWMIWVRQGVADFGARVFTYSASCVLEGSDSTGCPDFTPGNDVCVFDAMDWDRLDNLWVVNSEEYSGGTPAVRTAPPPPGEVCSTRTGPTCGLQWNITAYTNPNATGHVQPLGITTWKNSSTSQGYMVKTNQLDRVPESFSGMALCQPIVSGTTLESNLTGFIGWGVQRSGATATARRHAFNDCSTTATATLATDVGGGFNRIQRNNTSQLVFAYSTSASPEVKWSTDCLQSDLTGCNTYTPDRSKIYDTALRSTTLSDFDSDEGGSVLTCGSFVDGGGETDGWVAKYDLDTKNQDWNITYDLGTSTNVYSCQFDHFGGFYTQTVYTDAGVDKQRLSHYTGGGFAIPPKDELIQSPATTGTSPFSGSDGAIGFRNFCILNGFESDAGKFLCGLVYVLSGTVLMAAITRDLSKNAVLAIAAATAFGLMIFVTIVELWPTYTTVLIIILCSAVVIWAIKKQFLGFGGDE